MRVFEVGEVGRYIKELLQDDAVLADLWITGEVTNLSRSGAGHYYFALKDETSQLRSVLFRGAALRCGAEPRNGDAVVGHGRIAFYEPTGVCEFCVDLLYPSGVGIAQLRFEALRLKLEQEGLFAEERKRALPEYPRRIGLVTSEGGAVLHDVLTILARRYPVAEVVLAPSAVQGDHAPGEIVAALAQLAEWQAEDGAGIDVAIVARGGGSPEELAPFNDERVARAIFASPWPVISAVGHETDVTICDYVADLRAPTPSVAAEIVAPDLRLLAQEVRELAETARVAIEQQLEAAREELRRGRERLLIQTPLAQIARGRRAMHGELQRAKLVLAHQISVTRGDLAGRRLQLAALSPVATLARGYSIVSLAGDGVVRSARRVGVGQDLHIQLLDGVVDATATGTRTTDGVAPVAAGDENGTTGPGPTDDRARPARGRLVPPRAPERGTSPRATNDP